jgi:2-methylcitrate dehydratase
MPAIRASISCATRWKSSKTSATQLIITRPTSVRIANAVQVFFKDGTKTDKIEVEYPIGHRRRRADGIPLLEKKFHNNLRTRFPDWRCDQIMELCLHQDRLESKPVHEFMDLFVIN